ncbi:MAG: glycosyltransferase family protein, partial [Acidimicrobiales bacterium]
MTVAQLAPVAATRPGHASAGGGPQPAIRRSVPLLAATGAYLVLAVVVWWNIWSTHPTSVTTCGCGDSSLFTWFLEWAAYALSHGLDPLYSTAMFHPTGVNLLSNTSELAFGVLLAPVTWVFGPIATLNVALTLAPALSASAMFWLLRRWVTWTPAAFAGGLLYGFSPLVLVSLTDAHLMVGMLAVPPLVVACLDELLVRQRRRAVPSGAVLGMLIGVQFFIGTEVLTIMAMTGFAGLALLSAYAARHPEELRRRWRHAVVGLASAGGVAGIVLAYPVWFALAGPAHLSGAIWSNLLIGYGGTNFRDYVLPPAPSASFVALTRQVGGYQGQTLSGQYFGIGLVGVVLIGSWVWRRDRRLWLFGAIGVVTVALSFGIDTHTWVPWRLLARIPLIQNIVPSRFVSMTYLVAAIMVALVADHAATGSATRKATRASPRRPMPEGEQATVRATLAKKRRGLVAGAAGTAVSAVA